MRTEPYIYGCITAPEVESAENRIQQECYMWFHNSHPHLRVLVKKIVKGKTVIQSTGLYFEIHNNSFSARSGMKHKAIGRQPGISDNCLLLPHGQGPIFFEFKDDTGEQSEEQKAWQKLIESHGYKYYIVKSLEQFKSIISKYDLT